VQKLSESGSEVVEEISEAIEDVTEVREEQPTLTDRLLMF
jgi:hypothetical protein